MLNGSSVLECKAELQIEGQNLRFPQETCTFGHGASSGSGQRNRQHCPGLHLKTEDPVESILGPPAPERTSLLPLWTGFRSVWLETRTMNGCCRFFDYDWSDGRKVVRVTIVYSWTSLPGK